MLQTNAHTVYCQTNFNRHQPLPAYYAQITLLVILLADKYCQHDLQEISEILFLSQRAGGVCRCLRLIDSSQPAEQPAGKDRQSK